jgi:hypothetical protein
MLGNSFRRMGSENSANGMTTIAMKGMSRNRSTVVCVRSLRSRRVRCSPRRDLDKSSTVALMFYTFFFEKEHMSEIGCRNNEKHICKRLKQRLRINKRKDDPG